MEAILQNSGQRGVLGSFYRVEELVTRVWHTRMGQSLLQSGRVLTRVWLTRVGKKLKFPQSRGWQGALLTRVYCKREKGATAE